MYLINFRKMAFKSFTLNYWYFMKYNSILYATSLKNIWIICFNILAFLFQIYFMFRTYFFFILHSFIFLLNYFFL